MDIHISKRGLFFIIYAIIIAAILIYILFIAPDTLFLSKESKKLMEQLESQEPKEFLGLEEQFNHFNNNTYKYEYNILDSMTTKSYTFICEGSKTGATEKGSCQTPAIDYDETTKKDVFNLINMNYLEPKNIYELVKDIEPQIKNYNDTKVYTYSLFIKELKSDITIISGYSDISEIRIANAYITYVLKFSDMSY